MAAKKPKKLKIAKNWQSDAAARRQKIIAAMQRQAAKPATGGTTATGSQAGETSTTRNPTPTAAGSPSENEGQGPGYSMSDFGMSMADLGYTNYGSYSAPSNLKGKALERYKAIIGESKYNKPIPIVTASGGTRYEIAHPGGGPHTRITNAQAKAATAAYQKYFGTGGKKKAIPRPLPKVRPKARYTARYTGRRP